ncbi:Cnga3 [Symbiodinium sp. CCMP2592]|nr:Cnga3 [Symbiodinium sp. CCMP2592]
MAGVFAALGRLGQSLLGTTPLQQAQRHLASDEAAFAWRACEDLKFQASAEDLATAGVAAAAVGRLEEVRGRAKLPLQAVDILRRAARLHCCVSEETTSVLSQCFLCMRRRQQQQMGPGRRTVTKRDVRCSAALCAQPAEL